MRGHPWVLSRTTRFSAKSLGRRVDPAQSGLPCRHDIETVVEGFGSGGCLRFLRLVRSWYCSTLWRSGTTATARRPPTAGWASDKQHCYSRHS